MTTKRTINTKNVIMSSFSEGEPVIRVFPEKKESVDDDVDYTKAMRMIAAIEHGEDSFLSPEMFESGIVDLAIRVLEASLTLDTHTPRKIKSMGDALKKLLALRRAFYEKKPE